jgi:hypothetical protein
VADVFFEHLRWRGAPNTFAFHPANGGARRPVEAPTVDQLEAWGLLRKKVD